MTNLDEELQRAQYQIRLILMLGEALKELWILHGKVGTFEHDAVAAYLEWRTAHDHLQTI